MKIEANEMRLPFFFFLAKERVHLTKPQTLVQTDDSVF